MGGSTWGLVDPIDEVASWLHACGSGTGSGGPWEIVLACMQLDELMMKARGIILTYDEC